MSILNEIKREFTHGTVLMRLLFVNIAVFLFINITDVILFLFKIPSADNVCGVDVSLITYWLSVPSDISQLIYKPWTIFTYMFTQESVMHILFNMLVLYFSGKIFLQFLTEKKLLSTYVLGGLCGAALFILSYNIFPIFSGSVDCAVCLGASASVMAVMIAIASFAPNFTVHLILFGPVQLKYIALIYVVVDVISIKSGNAGGHIAHLGGALWGFFYIQQYKKGKDSSLLFEKIFDFFSGIFKRRPKMKVRRTSDEEFNSDKLQRQKKIDSILDKISKSGYESLSKEEKEFLFKASNNKI